MSYITPHTEIHTTSYLYRALGLGLGCVILAILRVNARTLTSGALDEAHTTSLSLQDIEKRYSAPQYQAIADTQKLQAKYKQHALVVYKTQSHLYALGQEMKAQKSYNTSIGLEYHGQWDYREVAVGDKIFFIPHDLCRYEER